MHRMSLIALKDFSFKGQSYAKGDRLDLPVGEAYKVVSKRQAKRANAARPGTASEPAAEAPAETLPPTPEPEPQPVAEEPSAQPETDNEPPAEEEKPRRRRRRQSSYEADAVPHEPSEPEWNSE